MAIWQGGGGGGSERRLAGGPNMATRLEMPSGAGFPPKLHQFRPPINYQAMPPIPSQYLTGQFRIPANYYLNTDYPTSNGYVPAMQQYYPRPVFREFPAQEAWAPQLFMGTPIGYYY